MTSYYVQTPTLAMRAGAVELVVVARIGALQKTDVETHDGKAYVRSTFDVHIDEVLKGTPAAKHLAVQVLGGKAGDVETPMSLPLQVGDTMVLMLSGATEPGVYVPYLASAYRVEPNGHVALGARAAEVLGLHGAAAAADHGLTVEALRKLVGEVVRAQHDEEAAERAARAAGALPLPTLELPTGHDGGGRSSAPEGGNPNRP